MREVLFRGKRVGNGEWVYGGYHKHIARQICPIGDKLEECDIKHLMIQSGFADWNMFRPLQATEVIPETVGQFTGLTDKNGTKIFEGDLVKVYMADDEYHKMEVQYQNGQFILMNVLGCYIDEFTNIEVIGNIHEREQHENK